MATWVIISGSPYAKGKCATVAKRLVDLLNDSDQTTTARFFSCATETVQGCIGCDECKSDLTCIYDDDFPELSRAIDKADAVMVISPIYFAGVPSQLKALLDRFQPYFWKRQQQIAAGLFRPTKRPLYVALIGEGGDPYGTDPARVQIASPFALADYAVRCHREFIKTDTDAIYAELSRLVLSANEELSQ